MIRLYSKDRPSITNHYCNTEELALVVKEYIESKYECTVEMNYIEGPIYYDHPGIRFINPELNNVVVCHIETSIADVDMLMEIVKAKVYEGNKGFCRISSYHGNLCLTEEELNETRLYIAQNEDLLESYTEKADEIFSREFKSKDA